jgi:AraC-like DNA-binding protein
MQLEPTQSELGQRSDPSDGAHRWGCFDEMLPISKAAGGIAWLHRGNTYDHPRHRHTALEMNLVASGRGCYEVDGQRHPLVAGSVLWIRPGEKHYLEERSEDFVMWILAAEASLIDRITTSSRRETLLPEQPSRGLSRLLPAAELRWLDRELKRSFECQSPDFLQAGISYALLGAWEATVATPETSPGEVLSAPLQRAVALLEDNPHWSRDDLAAAVNVAPLRLGRQFRAELGVGFTDYRNRLRLQRFFELRRRGRASMLGACLEAGFGSYAQFHRVFTGLVGTAPSRNECH